MKKLNNLSEEFCRGISDNYFDLIKLHFEISTIVGLFLAFLTNFHKFDRIDAKYVKLTESL